MKILTFFVGIVLILLSCTLPDRWEDWPEYPGTPGGYTQFIRVSQTDKTLLETPEGSQFLIKGIAFGNHVWGNPASPINFTHHGPEDYARVKALGFNVIRFYINYGIFENDDTPYSYKNEGFAWLDVNIAAARQNNIRLLFNMHYPQGGFQSNGNGDALWTNRNNQLRLIALWKEIARRYADEDIIIGYGLVNEPVPLTGVAEWTTLAQEIINGIREKDPHHLIFVERACRLKTEATQEEEDNNFFPANLNDPGPAPGIVYEYHLYEPMNFTHQNASWIPSMVDNFAIFPDPERVIGKNEQWAWFSDTNPLASTGTTPWSLLEGNNYTVTDTNYRLGRAVVQTHSIGTNGIVYVDDVVVEEYDQSGTLVRTIMNTPIDSASGWEFWSANGSGSSYLASGISGASGGECLAISGTTGDANIGYSKKFIINQNYQYKISGRIRGSSIASGATVRFRVDFYSCDGDIFSWNKDYLQSMVDSYIQYAIDHDVPMYLGEFGTIIDSFRENRGGITWVGDLLDILTNGNVNYNYHTYHETNFGLYTNGDWELPDPDRINVPLRDLFKSVQGGE